MSPKRSYDISLLQIRNLTAIVLEICSGKRIVRLDDNSTCVDIRGSNEEDGADLVAYEFGGQDNQKWEKDNV